ncbi:MAG: peptide-methionine (S)-S-oxide reductase MsrA [Paracoccaceae bacterium]
MEYLDENNAPMPSAQTALAGRSAAIETAHAHFVNARPLRGGRPEGLQSVLLGMGCFWGAERLFWSLSGVWVTSVGFAGGVTPNPTYDETCTGLTGHAEVVEVVFDAAAIAFGDLMALFWENHDPTQGMRQGNDVGSQYRSAIYTTTARQLEEATRSRTDYAARLAANGFDAITTEIASSGPYYLAEAWHQQYLAKNPQGYCGLKGTGVTCPMVPEA